MKSKHSIYHDFIFINLVYWIIENETFNGVTFIFCTDSYIIKNIIILINVVFVVKFNIKHNIRYYKLITL